MNDKTDWPWIILWTALGLIAAIAVLSIAFDIGQGMIEHDCRNFGAFIHNGTRFQCQLVKP